jgi:hypothetical protein
VIVLLHLYFSVGFDEDRCYFDFLYRSFKSFSMEIFLNIWFVTL